MKQSLLLAGISFFIAPFLSAQVSVHSISDSIQENTSKRDPIAEESLIAHNSSFLQKVEAPPLGEKFDVSKFNDGTLDPTGTSYFKSLWVVFRLNTEAAPNGFDVSEIRVYSGNKDLNASIFQNYDVYYHVVGAPENAWDLLVEGVKLENSEVGVSEAKFFSPGQETVITDASGNDIMKNVDAIKIDFSKRVLAFPNYSKFAEVIGDTTEAASTNFQEIVVLGKPASN